jgi:formylmethanofuran dehydrogenase subunit A
VHIHCNNLGVPGNVATTLATMESLDGRRAHYTHLQFHCYGKDADGGWVSAADQVIEYVNANPLVSVDVGQVMFGPATTISADGPIEYLLHASTGRKWVNIDVELETGCGMCLATRSGPDPAPQGGGAELFLLAADPWQVALSTDHPWRVLRVYPRRSSCCGPEVRDAQLAGEPLFRRQRLADGLSGTPSTDRHRPGQARGCWGCGTRHLGVGADADDGYPRDVTSPGCSPRPGSCSKAACRWWRKASSGGPRGPACGSARRTTPR